MHQNAEKVDRFQRSVNLIAYSKKPDGRRLFYLMFVLGTQKCIV